MGKSNPLAREKYLVETDSKKTQMLNLVKALKFIL